jgi:Short C-terminal domain
MPGLLRGMARTAVIAGTATAVSNRVSRRQAERWSQEDQSAYAQPGYAQPAYEQQAYAQPAAAPAAPPADDTIEQLTRLAQLRDGGVLTEEEFQAQKAKILNS